MNKAKIILPIASMFMLVGCGPKTKTVKEIWGNTWGYVNSSAVSYKLEDRQKLENLKDTEIDWANTTISGKGQSSYTATHFDEKDQKKENLLGSEFIRTSNYPIFKENRDFFAQNKIVVSSREDHKVKVGDTEYTDAEEKIMGDVKGIEFNGNQDDQLGYDFCDGEGYINELEVYVTGKDGKKHCNAFYYYITLKDGSKFSGDAYIELPCLA